MPEAAPLKQHHVVSGLDAVCMNTVRRLAQDFRYPFSFVNCFNRRFSSNVKVMATPLAGASVDRGVKVEIMWEHRQQRG
jgi:hypothetical protein